jgi:hypothetical protein
VAQNVGEGLEGVARRIRLASTVPPPLAQYRIWRLQGTGIHFNGARLRGAPNGPLVLIFVHAGIYQW